MPSPLPPPPTLQPTTPKLRQGIATDRLAMEAVMSPHQNAFFPGGLRGHRVRIAEIGETVVGFVGWEEDRILALYVAEGWRGRHVVGAALLSAAEEAIAAAGHRRVRVMIDADAAGAHHFYQNADYVTGQVDPEDDVAWMMRELP